MGNGEIFIVCQQFENVLPLYEIPCSSTSVGMMKWSNIQSKLKFLLTSLNIQFKAY